MTEQTAARLRPTKRSWTRPAVERLLARDGEAGPNPINPEGVLGNAS